MKNQFRIQQQQKKTVDPLVYIETVKQSKKFDVNESYLELIIIAKRTRLDN